MDRWTDRQTDRWTDELISRRDTLHARAGLTPTKAPDSFGGPSSRPAPPGFDAWLAYAREQRCLTIQGYRQIEEDLLPFRDPEEPWTRTITKVPLLVVKNLPAVKQTDRHGSSCVEALSRPAHTLCTRRRTDRQAGKRCPDPHTHARTPCTRMRSGFVSQGRVVWFCGAHHLHAMTASVGLSAVVCPVSGGGGGGKQNAGHGKKAGSYGQVDDEDCLVKAAGHAAT
jgi:hypothetical protein